MGVLNVDHTFSGDGTSKSYNVPVSDNYMFYAVGGFGGGILSLESSPDNESNWFTVEQLSEPGRLIRYLVSGERIRLKLVGSNNPSIVTGIRQ
tara:strand:- start:38 stop:316 length:279 start_codon:yes stop_codon:yes gene_type:complete